MIIEDWHPEEEVNYTPITTCYRDLSIAELFGINAIKDTVKRMFKQWDTKTYFKELTELVMVLNWKMWRYYETNEKLAREYQTMYYKLFDEVYNLLKDDKEKIKYFNRTLD